MKKLVLVVGLAALAAFWAVEWMTTAELRAQITALRHLNGELELLRKERARLQSLEQGTEQLATRRHEETERDRLQRELATPEEAAQRRPATALTLSEWLRPAAWKNRGYATPAATVETALWAASGGDVTMLKGLLYLDDSVRAKADTILARIPENFRATYATAEHLIAAFTAKSIPLGDAQLVWQQPLGPDDAVACVFVKHPDADATPPSPAPTTQDGPGKEPPMAPPNRKTSATYLSLHRSDDGWRLVVPMSAMEKIAKDLGAPGK